MNLIEESESPIAKKIIHCDNCGDTWYDSGIANAECPYCRNTELERDALKAAGEGEMMDSLVERLRHWAQNYEMIDQHYLIHGRDCSEAARLIAELERERDSAVNIAQRAEHRANQAESERDSLLAVLLDVQAWRESAAGLVPAPKSDPATLGKRISAAIDKAREMK